MKGKSRSSYEQNQCQTLHQLLYTIQKHFNVQTKNTYENINTAKTIN